MKIIYLLVKKEIVVDDEVVSGSQVETFESKFNGNHSIVVAVGSTNTFSLYFKSVSRKNNLFYINFSYSI